MLSIECKGTARAGLFPKGQRARSEPMVVTAPTGSSPIMLKQGRGDDSNRVCWQPSSRQAGQSLVHSGIQQQVRTAEARTYLSAQERDQNTG